MTVYEFKCRCCGCAFEELFLSAAAASAVTCPGCHGTEVERAMSAFGFASKGKNGEISRSSSSGHSCGTCASHACSHCH